MTAIRAATSGNGSVPAVWLFLRCFFCFFLLLLPLLAFLGCILLPKQALEGGVTATRAAGGFGSVPAVNPFFGNRPLCHRLVRGLPNVKGFL